MNCLCFFLREHTNIEAKHVHVYKSTYIPIGDVIVKLFVIK